MGILGASSKSAEPKGGHSGKAVLWLGATEAPLALVTHLRSRGIAVAMRTDQAPPVARLMLVEAADSQAARNTSIKNRRVAVIHPDPGSADALAQALRGRGAQVVALSLDPSALDRVEALDPDAVLMEVTDFYGSCWEIVRALWQHPRLKYAPVLLANPEGLATYAQRTPDVPSLCLAVQSVSEAYEWLERSAKHDDSFEVELAHLGPAKLLRALSESGRGFRVSLQGPVADFEIDVAEGIIVGAQSSAKGAANDRCLGVHALALLMTEERGTVHVRVAEHPATTNVMAPLDAALHAAREVKATPPQDAAAMRASAPRMSLPSPSLHPVKKTILGAPAPKQPVLSEPARASKRPEPNQPAPTAVPVPGVGSAREHKVEPEPVEVSKLATLPAPPPTEQAPEPYAQEPAAPVAAPEPRHDAPPLPSEPPTAARPLAIGAANRGADEPANASLAEPKKTLQGLPPPRRSTSVGALAAVAPRESGHAAVEPLPALPAAQPQRSTPAAAAEAYPIDGHTASTVMAEGEAHAALSVGPAVAPPAESDSHQLPHEDLRVTPGNGGASTPAAAYAEEGSSTQDTSDGAARSVEPAPAVTIRLERWHVWAAFGALGVAAVGWLGVMFFWQGSPQGVAVPRSVPALSAVAQPAAQNVEATKVAAPTPVPNEERAPNQDNAASANADAEDRAGERDEEGSSSGALAAKPPSRQASALVSRGHDLRKRRQYAQARVRYQEALALLPGYPRALAGLAQLNIAQNRGKEAVPLAQKLVAARPRQASYQLLLGDAYQAANMPKEAQQAWQTAARGGNSAAKTRLKSSTEALASAAAPAKNGTVPIAATKAAPTAKPPSVR